VSLKVLVPDPPCFWEWSHCCSIVPIENSRLGQPSNTKTLTFNAFSFVVTAFMRLRTQIPDESGHYEPEETLSNKLCLKTLHPIETRRSLPITRGQG
jgi:hypothetical protein